MKMTEQVAGHENDGPSKSHGVKMQDMKTQDMKMQISRGKIAGHENAGLENAGQEYRRHETIVYWLRIYRVLVRKALFGVAL